MYSIGYLQVENYNIPQDRYVQCLCEIQERERVPTMRKLRFHSTVESQIMHPQFCQFYLFFGHVHSGTPSQNSAINSYAGGHKCLALK